MTTKQKNKLLIMRGLPCSGKSSWIRSKGYDIFTLCPDTIRLMFAAPDPYISQEYNSTVWKLMFKILEARMEGGSFTIIDATHTTWRSIKPYLDLCDKYGYNLEIKDFSDVSLEDCIERNKNREKYKFVPEDIIKKMHQQIQSSKSKFEKYCE